MKITSQNDQLLVVKDGGIFGFIIGAVVALFAGYYLVSTLLTTGVSTDLWFSVGGVVVGLLVLFMTSIVTATLNKSTGQIQYVKKHLIGSSATTYAMADVLRIEVRKEWRTESSSGTARTESVPEQVLVSQTLIVFKDGTQLPLSRQSSPSRVSIGGILVSGQGTETVTANQIATFLNVPFQEIAPPNAGITINLGPGSINL